MEHEQITLDPRKNYLIEEPFFIEDTRAGYIEILRPVNADIFGRTVKNG